MAYSEFRFFSPVRDCEMIRLSMSGRQGAEYFVMLPAEASRRYSERRNDALELIEQAIRQGLEPGQVFPA